MLPISLCTFYDERAASGGWGDNSQSSDYSGASGGSPSTHTMINDCIAKLDQMLRQGSQMRDRNGTGSECAIGPHGENCNRNSENL